MTRVALYARYSSDQQREASIEDQLRLCRLHAEMQCWTVADSYQDCPFRRSRSAVPTHRDQAFRAIASSVARGA